MEIWNKFDSNKFIQSIDVQVCRIIEDQSRSMTRKLVDTSDEHDVLEEIIEKSKPKIIFNHDDKYFKKLHYLLSTPFRYPPLEYGSRFGSKLDRNLLYASFNITTALSEIAFYKFSFLSFSEGNLGGNTTTYTAFWFNITSDRFIDLCSAPFNSYIHEISSKTDYQYSQKLGSNMRENGIECFQYVSARDLKRNFNVGVFTPKCLEKNDKKLEKTFQSIKCYYTKDLIEFSYPPLIEREVNVFKLSDFFVDGVLPRPSN